MTLKTAVRQMLFSGEPINPSPNSLLPISASSWSASQLTIGGDILSEDGSNAAHVIFRNAGLSQLVNNIPYRWTVWVRPLNRRFCYLTIAPAGATTRIVTVWGLDGQGLLDTKAVGSNPINISTAYKNVGRGIYKLTFNFTITTGGDSQIPVIGIVDTFPPTYTASFDPTFQGLNQQSIQIIANECVPV